MPAGQIEHIHVATRLNSTYDSLIIHTTLPERYLVLQKGTADTGNNTSLAAYYGRAAEQGVSLAYCPRAVHTLHNSGVANYYQTPWDSRTGAAEHSFRLTRL